MRGNYSFWWYLWNYWASLWNLWSRNIGWGTEFQVWFVLRWFLVYYLLSLLKTLLLLWNVEQHYKGGSLTSI